MTQSKKNKREEKADRLAQALRDNLRRRKQSGEGTGKAEPETGGEAGG